MEDYIDMHSHILPYVDDGSKNTDMSMQMLRIAADDGISGIVLTPHNKPGHHPVDHSRIAAKAEALQSRLGDENIEMKLYIGSELYYRSELVRELENGLAGTMAGSQYVLVEFGPLEDYDYIRNGIYSLLMNGYSPILAHAERYQNICTGKFGIDDLIEMGCYIQVNAGSIMGKFGLKCKGYTRKLLKQHQIHFIATDAHDLRKRAPYLADCAEYVARKIGKEYSRLLCYENPLRIIRNEEILR